MVVFVVLIVILICIIIGFSKLTDKIRKTKKESYAPVNAQASKIAKTSLEPTAITN